MREPVKEQSSLLNTVLEKTVWVCGVTSGIALWGVGILTFVSVVARYVFNYGIGFAADFTTYLVCFLCFIGAVYGQWINAHVSVDIVTGRMPKKAQQLGGIVALLFGLIVCMTYLYWSATMVWESAISNTQTMSPLPIPLAIPQVPIPIGFFLLIVVMLSQLAKAIKGLRSTDSGRNK